MIESSPLHTPATPMRAVSQRSFGSPDVLELVELERPSPGPDDVLVRVVGASVNPADWKIRAGLLPRFGEPPLTIGLDFSGVVEAVGGAVERVRPGDEVVGCVYPPAGSYAQYVVAPASAVAPAPRSIPLLDAAALPVAGLTAWQPLARVADVRAGQRVLVHAAAGGVGHLAVQIAKARGAYVIGTARAEKHAFVRELGADEAIDYTAVDFAAELRDVDVVLDPISGDYGPRSLRVLRPDGLLVDVRGAGPDRSETIAQAEAVGRRFVQFGFSPSGEDLEQVVELVDRGVLSVLVEQRIPLSEVAHAHALSESGRVRGKLVLEVT